MKHGLKKSLSILLSAMTVVSAVPGSAVFAEDFTLDFVSEENPEIIVDDFDTDEVVDIIDSEYNVEIPQDEIIVQDFAEDPIASEVYDLELVEAEQQVGWSTDYTYYFEEQADGSVKPLASVKNETPPSCTEAGKITYTVTLSTGEKLESPAVDGAPATGHVETEIRPVPGTVPFVIPEAEFDCQSVEYEEASYCKKCGSEIENTRKTVKIDAKKDHEAYPGNWDDDAVEKDFVDPDNEDEGFEVYRKADQKLLYSTYIVRGLNSNGEEADVTTRYEEYYCAICGDLMSRTATETPHSWVEDVDEQEGDCEEGLIKHYHCAFEGCEETKTEKMDPAQHQEKSPENENMIPATCGAEGSYDEVVYCAICGKELSRTNKTIPALAHVPDYEKDEVIKEATCTEDGEISRYCTICKETYTEVIPAKKDSDDLEDHDNVIERELIRDESFMRPSCSSWGQKVYHTYCASCGKEFSRQVYNEETYYTDYDYDDDDEIWESIRPVSHRDAALNEEPWMELVDTVVEPSCKDQVDGVKIYNCKLCGEKNIRVIVPWDQTHDPGEEEIIWRKNESCTENGVYYTAHRCKICNELVDYSDDIKVPATGHTWVKDEKASKKRSCTEDGKDVYKCAKCGEERVITPESEADPELPDSDPATLRKYDHSNYIFDGFTVSPDYEGEGRDNPFDGWVVIEGAGYPSSCKVVGVVSEEDNINVYQDRDDHIGEPYYGEYWFRCKYCGEPMVLRNYTRPEHNWTDGPVEVVEKAATCTETGLHHYAVKCTICGEEDPETITETEEIPAKGHDWELKSAIKYYPETDKENRANGCGTAAAKCKVCGLEEKDHVVEHDFKEVEVTAATCETDGVAYAECKNCHYREMEHVVPAFGHAYGDWSIQAVKWMDEDPTSGNVVYTRICANDAKHVDSLVVPFEETESVYMCGKPGSLIHKYKGVPEGAPIDAEVTSEFVEPLKEDIEHTPAEPVMENEVPATCKDGGKDGSYDSVTYCAVCGSELKRETVILKAPVHTFDPNEAVPTGNEKNKDFAESDTEDWQVEYSHTCLVCGDTETWWETIPEGAAKGHTPGKIEYKWIKHHTCTEYGLYEMIMYCGDERCAEHPVELKHDYNIVDPARHDQVYTEREYIKEPTCTTPGQYIVHYYCEICGECLDNNEYYETTDIVTENESRDYYYDLASGSYIAAGRNDWFEKDGLYYYIRLDSSVTGHSAFYTKPEIKAATCTEPGSRVDVTYCGLCYEEISRSEAEEVPATGHIPGAAVKENEVAATCTSEGSYDSVVKCAECGTEISRVKVSTPKIAHTAASSVKENEVAATCETAGSYDLVTYCVVCNEEIGRIKVDQAALGHTPKDAVKENVVEATTTKKGSYDEVVYCAVCKKELSRKKVETDILPTPSPAAATPTPAPAETELMNTAVAVANVSVKYTGNPVMAGKVQVDGSTSTVTVKYYSDSTCTAEISQPVDCGTYYAKAFVASDGKYKAAESEVATIQITKKFQHLSTRRAKTVKYSKLAKKNQSFNLNAKTDGPGKITCTKVSGNSKIKISAAGKVTVKKGLKKGTYIVKIKYQIKGTNNFKKRTVTRKLHVTVA